MLWGLNFKLKLFSYIQTKSFDTCFVNRISCIQVCPTKFTFVKIKAKENFGEFLRFFPEGLNPFKIHRRFKFESVPKLITWISLWIISWPNWHSLSEYSILSSCKVWEFLEQWKVSILNLQIWVVFGNLDKYQTSRATCQRLFSDCTAGI
jgi:hypothetical protein